MKTKVNPKYTYKPNIYNNICYESEKKLIVPKSNRDEYIYDLHVLKEWTYETKLVDISLAKPNHCLDVILKKISFVRIFGTIKNKTGEIAKHKKVSVYRSTLLNYKTEYVHVCIIMTDELGFYETIIDSSYCNSHFCVKISD